MASWVTFFIVGLIFGKSGLGSIYFLSFYYELGFFSVLILLLKLKSRHPYLYLFLLILHGFFWGMMHSAPDVDRFLDDAQISFIAPLQEKSPTVLVTHNSLMWEMRSNYPLETKGFVFCKPTQTIFSKDQCIFMAPTQSASKPSYFDKLDINPERKMWVGSMLMGEMADLPNRARTLFRELGIYHLLVVSGMHITILAMFFAPLISFFFRVFYIFKMISPVIWPELKMAIHVLEIAAVIIFGYTVGLTQASQRAILIYVVLRATHILGNYFGRKPRLILALTLQAVFFPWGFLSESSLLSWCSYLFVLQYCQQKELLLPAKIKELFMMQIKITVLVAVVFGQLSIIGVFLNILIAPVIPLTLVALIAQLLPNNFRILADALWLLFDGFLQLLEQIFILRQSHYFSWFVINLTNYFEFLRYVACGVFVYFILNAIGAILNFDKHSN